MVKIGTVHKTLINDDKKPTNYEALLVKIKKYDKIINTPIQILDPKVVDNIDASSLIIKCGKILESIIQKIYANHIGKKQKLYTMITELHDKGIINTKVKTYAHSIRSSRNDESHNEVESTIDDATVVVLSLTQLIAELEKMNSLDF